MTSDEYRENLLRRIGNVENELKRLDNKVSGIEIKNATDEVHRVNVEGRLKSIEDTLKWLVRLIIGALLMALIAFAIGGGLAI